MGESDSENNIERIVWDPKYETGLPVIDAQHKSLVDLCNKFYQELMQHKVSGEPKLDDLLSRALKECVEYVKMHFRNEENLMTASGYKNFAAHKSQHDAFIKQILEISKKFPGAKVKFSFQFIKFMEDWILSHIAYEDQLFVKCVQDYYHRTQSDSLWNIEELKN